MSAARDDVHDAIAAEILASAGGTRVAMDHTRRLRVLRITTTDGDPTMLRLEGRLAGPWVDELARAWDALLAERDAAAITIRLDAVTFVDAAGKALCRRMHAAGAVLEASGCMMRAIVDEIVAGQPTGGKGGAA